MVWGLITIFGLIWGPWTVLGIVIINMIFSLPYDPEPLYIQTFLLQFLLGYLPYKLWYSLSNDTDKVFTPKLDSVFNLTKFIKIISITSILFSALYLIVSVNTVPPDMNWNYAFINFLNIFVLSFVIGIIMLIIHNTLDLNFKTPVNEISIKDRYSDIALTTGIISGILILTAFILNFNFPDNIMGNIILLIPVFSFLVFALRQIRHVPVRNKSIYSPIIEKFIFIFLLISIFLVFIIAVATYDHFFKNIDLIESSAVLLLNVFLVILITFIPGMLILRELENKVTTPLTMLAEKTHEYLKREDDDVNFIANYINLIEEDNEIGEVANSFLGLINQLEEHVSNLQRITSEKERIDAELNVATEIQKATLPKDFLISDKFKINASMSPAREVGGDFYDFYMLDDDRLVIAIGDASGKGIPAAIYAVITKALIKDQILLGRDLKDVFISVNNTLCENNETTMFVTVWVGIIDLNSGRLTFVNAGHNNPAISEKGKFNYFKSRHGLVLGAMEDMEYDEDYTYLNHGDYIYLYTDGITEAHNPGDDLFGDARLLEVLNRNGFNVKTILSDINREIEKFTDGREQFDDMTMLCIEI